MLGYKSLLTRLNIVRVVYLNIHPFLQEGINFALTCLDMLDSLNCNKYIKHFSRLVLYIETHTSVTLTSVNSIATLSHVSTSTIA